MLVGGPAAPAQAGPPEDAVLDWNTYALEALVNAPSAPIPGAGRTPPVSALHLAMVHGAVYDAVNMIDGGYEPYLHDLPVAPASASKAAAVATAAHDVLIGMVVVPALSSDIVDRLDGLYADSIAAATAADSGPAVVAGIAAGAAAPRRCSKSGRTTVATGRSGSHAATVQGSGDRPRPTSARLLPAPSDPFAKGPHAMTSDAYAKDYDVVKEFGAVGSPRTPEQDALAGFCTNNVPPPELFNRTSRGSRSSSRPGSS